MLVARLAHADVGRAEGGAVPLSFYDWQPGITLSARNARVLREAGVGGIILRAGSLTVRSGDAVITSELREEVLASYRGLDLTLCYRAEPDFTSSFERLDAAIVARRLAARYSRDAGAARALGCRISGVQLDFDCPTRLLGRYAALLRSLKGLLGGEPGCRISITALQSWMTSWRFFALERAADFYVLMLYGGTVPARREDLAPLVPPRRSRTALWLARLRGSPYVVGLPAYSLALVYDAERRLVSVESDLSLAALAGSRFLRHLESAAEGDARGVRHVFQAAEAVVLNGRALSRGWFVVLQEMTADDVGRLARWAREAGGANLKGIAVHRLQKRPADTSLPAEAVLDAVGSVRREGGPHLRSEVRPVGRDVVEVDLELANPQPLPNRFGRLPAVLELRVRSGEFLTAEPGDFTRVRQGHGFERSLTPAGTARANLLRFEKGLVPGREAIRAGSVRLRRTGEDFALYLYALWDGAADGGVLVCPDFEIFPLPAEQRWERRESPP